MILEVDAVRDITREVNVSTDFEFFWGEPQGVLVIFKNGDVMAHRDLKNNTLDGAIHAARNFTAPSVRTPARKVAHA